jgi:transcriptional regulator with XRE-family HTH domain
MSRQTVAKDETNGNALGFFLRELREKRHLSLWQVAGEAEMDSTLLSKIELGHRLPTPRQAQLLAKFFEVPIGQIEGRRIMESIVREHADNPAFGQAMQMLQETAPAYIVNKSVNRRRTGSE